MGLINLKKVSAFISDGNLFTDKIVKSLKKISFYSFSEIIVFTASLIYIKNSVDLFENMLVAAPIFIVSFVAITIGFLFLVLTQLFDIFLKIKEENDKTI